MSAHAGESVKAFANDRLKETDGTEGVTSSKKGCPHPRCRRRWEGRILGWVMFVLLGQALSVMTKGWSRSNGRN